MNTTQTQSLLRFSHKTIEMPTFRLIVVCIVAIKISSIQAKITYDEIEANIFDEKPRDYEQNVFNSIQTTKDVLSSDAVATALVAGVLALEKIPKYGELAKSLPMLRYTLEDRSSWREAFTNTIASETMRTIAESENAWMEATIQTIQEKFNIIGENNPNLSNRKAIASIIHTDLDRMLNIFETNIYRKNPLISSPPLILLASLIAAFSPIAKELIPFEEKNSQIACRMHDILLDYRKTTVNARLQRLSTQKTILPSLFDVMSMPYNPNGYNKTNPGAIDCDKGCKWNKLCLKDEFSSEEFYVKITKDDKSMKCVHDYAALIRYRVEQLFPIELMSKLCIDQKSKQITGEIFEF